MVNKVILVGNVGLDPEVRTLEGGAKVARVRLATTERLFDRQANETKEHTEWHTVTLWRGLADVVDRYVRKGSQIYIEGRLRTREWMDKDNNKRYTTEILADTMNLLGRRSDNPANGGQGQPYAQPAPQGGYASGAQGGYQQGASGGFQFPVLQIAVLHRLELGHDFVISLLVIFKLNAGGHRNQPLGPVEGRGRVIAQGQLFPHVQEQFGIAAPAEQSVPQKQRRPVPALAGKAHAQLALGHVKGFRNGPGRVGGGVARYGQQGFHLLAGQGREGRPHCLLHPAL